MKSERIAVLMAKKASRSASQEELEELEQLLTADPGAAFTASIIDRMGNNAAGQMEFAEQGWEKIVPRLSAAPVTAMRIKRGWWAAAAAVVGLTATGIGWQWWRHQHLAIASRQEITAPLGQTMKALLPDGTTVWLNAGSKLSYDQRFNNSRRDIQVSGEIFLDVIKNDARPFVVHTRKLDVHVLGTSFNIKAYDDDNRSEVAVVGGKVQVIMHNSLEKKVILLPHEKLILSTIGKTDSLSLVNFPEANGKDSLVAETAWREQKLVFKNETFESVARKMERQFNVSISFEDESLKKEILSGVFEKEGIVKALKLLQMTTPFHFRIQQRQVYISK
ncbi:FecR family protein [Chitinophaga polysaccharea]|uniref:FecR family protein n=1 Tax=Chitinophaga polysaccharea TaxID=1293035 RepID=A0A561PP04_9BACT|nr:FecR domain-containing protein [Chitinophaga polysaccharea]TWF39839.1 FecR family protein [Chitinophaga polysaccharea]